MDNDSRMIMTVRINSRLAAAFNGRMEEIGLRRDTYLNKLLPDEVDRLSTLPPNSERMAKYARLNWQMYPERDARLSLKLDTSLVQRITTVCREKGIPRDQFIETFLDYLVNGYEGDVPSPLGKACELLIDPYREADVKLNIYTPLHHEDWLYDGGVFKKLFDDVMSHDEGNPATKDRKE